MEKLIVANWKMNPPTEKMAVKLARTSDKTRVVVVPPFIFLEAVSHVLRRAELGAQDLSWEDASGGAYTGEVSARMLKDADVKYVILGHSERRRLLKETDKIINKKVRMAFQGGLRIILCIGESWSVRRRGLASVRGFIENQLKKDLRFLTKNFKPTANNLIVAYEPVWAIGTGRDDNLDDAALIARFIKQLLFIGYKLRAKVLYGGSVSSKNAAPFLKDKNIDGVLLGGASLRIGELKKILKILD